MRLRATTARLGLIWTIPQLIASPRFGEIRPDFFALKPNRTDRWIAPPRRGISVDTHNCLSNREMYDEVIKDVIAFFKNAPPSSRGVLDAWGNPAHDWDDYEIRTPFGRTFLLMTSDHPHVCACETCAAAMRAEGGRGFTQYAQVVWKNMIRVINEVTAACPDAQFGIVAMGLLQVPPRNVQMPKNVFLFQLTRGPDPELFPSLYPVEENSTTLWSAYFPRDRLGFKNISRFHEGYTNSYAMHPGMASSLPLAHAAYFKKQGRCCGHMWHSHIHNMAHDHLNLYVSHKVLWDLDTDVDALLDEYYAKFYGPAHEPMKQFWEEMERQYRELCATGQRSSHTAIWTGLYGPETMSRWKGCFERAKELAAGADPIYARWLAYMRAMVHDPLVAGQEEFAGFQEISNQTRIKASRVTGAPPIPDGRGDDPPWQTAQPHSLQLADTADKRRRSKRPRWPSPTTCSTWATSSSRRICSWARRRSY